jgi:heptaprenylglyceryl phosphate synthase
MKKSKYIRHYFAVSNTDGIFSIMVKDGDLVLGETVLNTGSTMFVDIDPNKVATWIRKYNNKEIQQEYINAVLAGQNTTVEEAEKTLNRLVEKS